VPERRDPTRDVLDAVRHLVRALRLSHHEAERRVGLSAAQLFVLQTLAENEPLSLKEVAARTATDQSSVSVVVGRLVEGGLVRRRRSRSDGRRVDLSLTAKARTVLEKGPPLVAQRILVDAVEALSAPERARLSRLLGKVVASMGAGAGTPGMFFEAPPGARGPEKKRRRRNGA
jgi:DNA-binding MarR family transcriptional regulator